jgi:hypothetical protein
MRRSITSRTVRPLVGAIVLIAAAAVVASGAFGNNAAPAPTHVPTTTPPPITAPTPKPIQTPTAPPADGVFAVDLKTLTDHDVSVKIDDETDSVVEATSGNPGDGMSVRWFDVKVGNIDAETLRIVWVGLGRDEVVHLGISRVDGKVRLRFVQDGPPANSDAVGFDRVLNLKFVVPVRSEDVLTSVQEGLDTVD